MKLYKREVQGLNNGFIFKSFENYQNGKEICYIPENASGYDFKEFLDESYGYTRKDFEKLCEGTRIDPDYLFELVDWQFPQTLLDELLSNDEVDDELS